MTALRTWHSLEWRSGWRWITDHTHLYVKAGAFCTKSDAKKAFPIAAVFSGKGNKGTESPWCSGEVRNAVVTPGQWHPTTGSVADSQVGTYCFVKLQVYWFQVRRKAIFHLCMPDNNQSPKRMTNSLGGPSFFLSQFPKMLQQNQSVQESLNESTAIFSQRSNSHRNHKISFPTAAGAMPGGPAALYVLQLDPLGTFSSLWWQVTDSCSRE